MPTTALMILMSVLMIALLGVSIPTLAIIAGGGDEVPPEPSFPYLSAHTYTVAPTTVPVNGTTPTHDVTIQLPVGSFVIQWRIFGSVTSASDGTELCLVLSSPAVGAIETYGYESAYPLDSPTYLDCSEPITPSYGIIMDLYSDVIVTSTSSPTSYLGLLFDDIAADTFTIVSYNAIVYQIA